MPKLGSEEQQSIARHECQRIAAYQTAQKRAAAVASIHELLHKVLCQCDILQGSYAPREAPIWAKDVARVRTAVNAALYIKDQLAEKLGDIDDGPLFEALAEGEEVQTNG